MAENSSTVAEEKGVKHYQSRLSSIFPKIFRIRRKAEFQRFRKKGKRIVGSLLCMDYYFHVGPTKMGLSVSSKYGKAHERNRFKRIAREAFRLSREEFPPSAHLHLIPRQKAKSAKMQDIQEELRQFINEIKPLAESGRQGN